MLIQRKNETKAVHQLEFAHGCAPNAAKAVFATRLERLKLLPALLLVLSACAPAPEMPPPVPKVVLEHAHGLIGTEVDPPDFFGLMKPFACKGFGYSGPLGEDNAWSYIVLTCIERTVVALARAQPKKDERIKWRITDTLALPETRHPDEGPFPWRMGGNIKDDRCDIEGFPSGTAVFGLSRRKDLPLKLVQAWRFDLEQGRIVPVDPSSVSCGKPPNVALAG
jgi:hypothetical protein